VKKHHETVLLPGTMKLWFDAQHNPVDRFEHCSLFSFLKWQNNVLNVHWRGKSYTCAINMSIFVNFYDLVNIWRSWFVSEQRKVFWLPSDSRGAICKYHSIQMTSCTVHFKHRWAITFLSLQFFSPTSNLESVCMPLKKCHNLKLFLFTVASIGWMLEDFSALLSST